AGRLELNDVAGRLDLGVGVGEADVAHAVSYASEVALDATRDSVQTLGGHGFIRDHPAEIWYRSAAALAAIDFDPTRSAFEPALLTGERTCPTPSSSANPWRITVVNFATGLPRRSVRSHGRPIPITNL